MAQQGTPFNELSKDQWVWINGWEYKTDALKAVEAEKKKKAEKSSKKPKKAAKAGDDEGVPPPARIAARVVSSSADECVVAPVWGQVCFKCNEEPELNQKNSQPATIKMDKSDLSVYPLKMEASNIEGRQDMTDMAELGVGELMHCLRQRYKRPKEEGGMIIYTYVGNILIAMNPMEDIGLTKLEIKQRYHGKKFGDPEIEPNIYAIGEAAYVTLIETKKNQSIVISGESGAGKSESTKQVLEYIAFCSEKSGSKSSVNDQILATSESLEAFGNAKTKRNHNSSRFGKLVTIQFDPQGGILGAEIRQYLLEKSRIVNQEVTERNYHIFYQMLVGLKPDKLAGYKITKPEDYRYLIREDKQNEKNWPFRPDGTTSLGDPKSFAEIHGDGFTGGHLGTLKMTDEFRDVLWRCMAAIITIGELDFKAAGEFAAFGKPANVAIIADLLQVDKAELEKTLLQKAIGNAIKKFNQNGARDNAGSLAKGIYGAFFVQMVEETINKTIGTTQQSIFIGVLDIFGFESFQKTEYKGKDSWIETQNKFEQLCINLTNEQLQNYFYQFLIPGQIKIYEEEGMHGITLYWADNGPCLRLCMGKGPQTPSGPDTEKAYKQSLFALLDDCVKQEAQKLDLQEHPEKAEQMRLAGIKAANKDSWENVEFGLPGRRMYEMGDFVGYLKQDLKHSKDVTDFVVYHYAGEVWYTVNGSVESNKNKLSNDLQTVIKNSKLPYVATLLEDKPGHAHFDTVSGLFADSLHELEKTLWEMNPFFVRCVKPNCIMIKGGFFEDHKVLN